MATNPLFPPVNVEPIDKITGKFVTPWILFFREFTNQAAAAGSGTVTNVTGTAPIASSGGTTPAISLNNAGVTLAKIQNATANSKLLGSGASGSGSSYSELSLGTGLSMSGITLNASGGSGTVTTTGSPASGNLTKFSGATSITNGDLSGDVTTSSTLVTALSTTGVSAATYGDNSHVGQFTVDAKGRISAASNVSIVGGTGGGGLVLLEQHTASSSATLDFTTGITSSYDDYVFRLIGLVNATNTQDLQVQISHDGGSTWIGTSTYYDGIATAGNTGAVGIAQDNAQAQWRIFGAQDNSSGIGVSGHFDLFMPLSALPTTATFDVWGSTSAAIYRWAGSAYEATSTTVNAIRFKFASGNITSGVIRLYAYTK